MHVLIVPSWYPTDHTPVAGIFFKDQAIALKEQGYKVTVAFPEIISLRNIKKEHKDFIIKKEDGIPTYRYKVKNFFPRRYKLFERLIFATKLKILVKKIIEEQGTPDIIHAHSSFLAGWASNHISSKYNIPVVLTEHSSTIGKGEITYKQKRLLGKILNNANKVISVGPGLKRTLSEYVSPSNIEIIPNLVNTEEFQLEKTKNKKFRFFSLARLDNNKGMDILIKAFIKAFSNLGEVELVVGGDGPIRDELEKLVAAEGFQERIHFLGQLSRNEVINEMQGCDAFALASKYETFGIVYLEALACGKPIIATECGGPEIIVNKQNGLLVPKDSINDLSEALISVFKQIDKFSAEEIRNDCVNRFGRSTIVHKLTEVYDEVIDNIKPSS